MPHLTVWLTDVHCNKTEDTGVLGSEDELFITGGIVAGSTSKAFLTSILDMNNGQTRTFPPEDSLLFDGDVPDGANARLVLRVYDKDSGGEWQNRRALIDGAQAELDRRLRERRPHGGGGEGDINFEEIVQVVGDALQAAAEMDQDDNLGEHNFEYRVSNSVDVEDNPYSFKAERFAANYSIGFRVRQYRDGLSQADAEAIWRQKAEEAERRRRR